jgi:hypothetical protein
MTADVSPRRVIGVALDLVVDPDKKALHVTAAMARSRSRLFLQAAQTRRHRS